jgi:hypothetical protein
MIKIWIKDTPILCPNQPGEMSDLHPKEGGFNEQLLKEIESRES